MKRKYFLLVLFFILAIFFIINTSSVNATMYKILDSEGNVIRLTNNPVLSIEEKEAGYTIYPPPGGSIEPMQEQIVNGQEIKQEISSGSEKYNFRKANWGMSREQVRATEDKKPDFEDDTSLGYDVKINGKDFRCIYGFLEDKLYNGGYGFAGKHTNDNLYIDDYEELKKILTKKYGKPKTDLPGIWKNNLYKNDRSHWGMAISVGHLVYAAQWETSTTTISMMISGDNFKISLTLTYDSKELREWAKRIKEKEASKDF